MDEELQQVKAMLRSVLLSSKEGVTAERFLADYRSVTGELLPFKKFGYSTQNNFVASLPDVVHIQSNKFGEMVYHAVADDTTAHIQRLVSKQKSKKTKGPLRRTSVRHPTRPFRGRGGSNQFRGRGSSSYVSSYAPSVRGRERNPAYNRGGRGYFGRGSSFSSRGAMSFPAFSRGTAPFSTSYRDTNSVSTGFRSTTHVSTGFRDTAPVSTSFRDKTPVSASSRETTPVAHVKPSVEYKEPVEVWESEDIDSVEADTQEVGRTPFTHMQITFDVNSPPKQNCENSMSSSRRRVTDSNRMVFKALDAAIAQQEQENKALTKMRYSSAYNVKYEVPPRFRKLEESKGGAAVPGPAFPMTKQPPPSNVSGFDAREEIEIQQRVVEILSGAQNGLWSTRVEVVYAEKYGKPPFDLIERIKSWPHIARVDQVPSTDRAIVHLVREEAPPRHPTVTSSTSTSTPPTPTPPVTVIPDQTVIWKNFTIPPPDLLELGDNVTVYVTFARHCDDFCIQREDCIVDFITEKLLKHCGNVVAPKRSVLNKGVYGAALYNVDESWYRAQILSDIHDDMVQVSFIDYGNEDQVRVDDIRPLSEEIAHIPAQAIPCALFGVKISDVMSDDKTSPSLLAFAELVRDTSLQATTIAHTIDGQCEVDLYVTGNDVSINQQLIDRHLLTSSLASGVNITEEEVQEIMLAGEPDELVLPDDKLWDVYISFLSPNLELNMRLVGEMYSDKLEEFERLMEESYELSDRDAVIFDGMICVANIDTLYHRVRVFSVANGKASVYFCDHGDKEIVNSSQLRPLPADLNQILPYQAIQCHLYGFEMLEDNITVLELLLDLALGKILVADIISREEDLSVVLYDTLGEEDININQLVAMELSRKGEKRSEALLSTLSNHPSSENLCTSNELEVGERDAEIASTDSFETAHSNMSAPSRSRSNERTVSPLEVSEDVPEAESDVHSTKSIEDVLKEIRKTQSDVMSRKASGDGSDVRDAETGDLSRNVAMVTLDDGRSGEKNNEYTERELFFDPKSLVTHGACFRCDIVTDLTEIATRGIMTPSGDSIYSPKSLHFCEHSSDSGQTKGGESTELDIILSSGDSGYSSKPIHGCKYYTKMDSRQSEEIVSRDVKISDNTELKRLYTWDSRKPSDADSSEDGLLGSRITEIGVSISESRVHASEDNIPENRVTDSRDSIAEHHVNVLKDNIAEKRIADTGDSIAESRVTKLGDSLSESDVNVLGDSSSKSHVNVSVENISESRVTDSGDSILQTLVKSERGAVVESVDNTSERSDVSGDSTSESCDVASNDVVSERVAMSNGDDVTGAGLPPALVIPDQGHFMDVHVISVLDPSNFVCVLYEMVESLQKSNCDLDTHFTSCTQLSPLAFENLTLDEVYAGCIEGVWCRLILKTFLDDEASVYLPDQGQYNIIPAQEIYDLPRKFFKLPFVAIRAKLHGIEPTGADWSESVKFKFFELVQGNSFVAFIVDKDEANCTVSVKLIDTSGDSDVCIDDVLLEQNFAKRTVPSGE